MFKKVLDLFNNFEKTTNHIIKFGLYFCFLLCMISILILTIYLISKSPFTYYIGISIFRLSNIFCVEFIICGFVVDNIKKQLI